MEDDIVASMADVAGEAAEVASFILLPYSYHTPIIPIPHQYHTFAYNTVLLSYHYHTSIYTSIFTLQFIYLPL